MRKPRFLVGCERSGVMAAALRRQGAIAASCDLEPSNMPGWHIQGDVREAIRMGGWDAMIAHPVCRYLTNAGAKHLYLGMRKENGPDEIRWAKMRQAAAFFRELLDAPIPFIAIENPVMHGHARQLIGRKFSFSYQPWHHGEPEFKRSCIWGNLPVVEPSNRLTPPRPGTEEHKRWSKVHRMPPGPDSEEKRSETLPGVAEALAAVWVPFVRDAINQRAAA